MSRLESLKRVVQIAPDDPLSHFGLGLELLNLQRWQDAAEAFRAALRVDANYSAAHYQLGRALISAGDLDAARAALDEGLVVARRAGDAHTESEMRALLDTIA